MANDSSFDIFLSLGIVVKGQTETLRELIKYVEDIPDVTLVFTKISGDKLRIVDAEEYRKLGGKE